MLLQKWTPSQSTSHRFWYCHHYFTRCHILIKIQNSSRSVLSNVMILCVRAALTGTVIARICQSLTSVVHFSCMFSSMSAHNVGGGAFQNVFQWLSHWFECKSHYRQVNKEVGVNPHSQDAKILCNMSDLQKCAVCNLVGHNRAEVYVQHKPQQIYHRGT